MTKVLVDHHRHDRYANTVITDGRGAVSRPYGAVSHAAVFLQPPGDDSLDDCAAEACRAWRFAVERPSD